MTARRREIAGWIFAGVLVLAGAALRIGMAFADPAFDRAAPDRMLKSDPALLHYLVEHIARADGLVPGDLRADPRIEHPSLYDVPANLPVLQEITTAWLYRSFGTGLPLHVFAVMLMGVVASAATLGVHGLARELTGSVGAACFAAALFALSPAAYRTIGFIFVNEDFALPFYALHLWLLARALRVRTTASVGLAGLALGIALASWHAMSFVLTLEVAVLFAFCLRTGRSPFAERVALTLPYILVLFGLAVPFLWKTRFLLSLPMALMAGLVSGGLLESRLRSTWARRAAMSATALAVLAAGVALDRAGIGGMSDYAHVFELVIAKLRFLGEKPANPDLLGVDARIMWQGPFETASVRELFTGSVVGCVLLPVALAAVAPTWWRGRGDVAAPLLVALALLTCVFALLIRRNIAFAGLLLPAVAAFVVASSFPRARAPWLAGLVVAQGLLFANVLPIRQVPWYFPEQQAELAAALPFIRDHVPRGDAILADCVSSGAILAGTQNPVVLQPKWEAKPTRERLAEFLAVFYFGSLDDFRHLLEKYDAPFVMIDREALWRLRWAAGFPEKLSEPVPNTPAAAFLAHDAARLEKVPGFRLVYRSALPTQLLWIYELRRPSAPAPETGALAPPSHSWARSVRIPSRCGPADVVSSCT